MNDFGANRFFKDLEDLGYLDIEIVNGVKNQTFVIIRNFEVENGRFKDSIIDLGIPVPNDYPRSLMACINVKSNPILLEISNSPGKYNIIKSPLGNEWRYWSNRFSDNGKDQTLHIITQVNGIFKDI